MAKQKITTFLWFDDDAEEAMRFYVSIFRNSKIIDVTRNGDKVMAGTFELEGQRFIALNGGPQFKFTEAISLQVLCKKQKEVDELWRKLSAGGEEGPCGWLKDKFGLSWQIVPSVLPRLLEGDDPERVKRVMEAMFQMKKLDIARLKQARRR